MFELLIAGAALKGAASLVPVTSAPAPRQRITAGIQYPAPGTRAVLYLSDESEGGDFPQVPAFVRAGDRVYKLGSYRRVNKVKWTADGRTVSFEGAYLKEYGVDDVCSFTWKVGTKTMQKVILRQEKDEPTG